MDWLATIQFLGSASFLTAALAYLGKSAIDSFAAGRLESVKAELDLLSNDRRDAMTRKRDVYSRVATSMRVFLAGSQPSTDDEKREFEHSFDQSFLWASEEVGKTLIDFLQLSIKKTENPANVTNTEFKDAYRRCLVAMRRDCGFPDTDLVYPVANFQ